MSDNSHFNFGSQSPERVVFIDRRLDNYRDLIAGFDEAEAIAFSADTAIEEITASLTNYRDLASIEFVTHGSPGSLQLGETIVDRQNLSQYEENWQSWSESLAPNGDILLYGCNIAAGSKEFLADLSELTQADIAASDDLTGSSLLGGDWELEFTVGEVEAIRDRQADFYTGVLDTYNPGLVGLAASIYQGQEGGTVEVAISRSQGSDGRLSIDYDTVDMSAIAGSDYVANSGTLVLEDGETTASFTIEILEDEPIEDPEQIAITIDNLVGDATLLAPRTALINIVDREAKPQPLINLSDFVSTTQLIQSQNIVRDRDGLQFAQLTEAETGSVFFEQPLSLDADTSFSTNFRFQLGDLDRKMAFVLHNDADKEVDYSLIANSVVVEFGHQQNAELGSSASYLSLFENSANSNYSIVANLPSDLNLDEPLTAWVDYDGTKDLLEVSLANSSERPEAPMLLAKVDLASTIGDRAFLGFSAETSPADYSQLIDWEFTSTAPLLASASLPRNLRNEVVFDNLDSPTAIDWTADGEMMFIAEKPGVIKVVRDEKVLATPFIDFSDRVNHVESRGLLDLAVHPQFLQGSPYVYAVYTYDPPEAAQHQGLAGRDGMGNRASRLSRFTADAATNFTTVLPDSEVVMLGRNSDWSNFNPFVNSTVNFEEPAAGILEDGSYLQDFLVVDSTTHTVGSVEFGADGALYISNGDGGSYNQIDPRNVRVQDLDSLSGKVLRVDPITGEGLADNPFYNGDKDANRSKVYQYGLRNPFRITIHPETNELYIGDVGRVVWEEINHGEPGANFGWPFYEGGSPTTEPQIPGRYGQLPEARAFYASEQSTVAPALIVNHQTDGINAIILGDLYLGDALPPTYYGDLFFNDLGQGIVRNVSFDVAGNISNVETFAMDAQYVVQIKQGSDGHLYYVDLDDGLVGRWLF